VGFCGGEFFQAEVIDDQKLRFCELISPFEVGAGASGEQKVFNEATHGEKERCKLMAASLHSEGFCQKCFADSGLPDNEQRSSLFEPLKGVEIFDLRFTQVSFGREIKILEAGFLFQARGLDSSVSFSLLTKLLFGLQERL